MSSENHEGVLAAAIANRQREREESEKQQDAGMNLSALTEKYALTMTLTVDWSGGRGNDIAEPGDNFRVDLTLLDPVTRLTRSGFDWYWDQGQPEGPVSPTADLFREVLWSLQHYCRQDAPAGDIVDWLIAHEDVFGSAEHARREYACDLALVAAMRQFWGEAGYREFLAADLQPPTVSRAAPRPAPVPLGQVWEALSILTRHAREVALKQVRGERE